MTTVREMLVQKGSEVLATPADSTVAQAVATMAEAKVGSLIVEAYPKVLGIFTERDLLTRVVAPGLDPAQTPVTQVMSAPLASCPPDADLRQCAREMARRHIRHMVVMDGDQIVGLLSLRDVLNWLIGETA